MASLGTGRPPTERDMVQGINGSPKWLGSLVSTGAAVNNVTTATPFNQTALTMGGAAVPGSSPALPNLTNTLAGKVLLLQASAAGVVMGSNNPNMVINLVAGQNIVALQTVQPPLSGTVPGALVPASGSVYLTMLQSDGWLQWLPLTGSATLHVFESL